MSGFSSLDKMVSRLKQPERLVCGVAAKVANKFNWSCLWTRVVWAALVLMNPAMGLLIYFVLAIVLPKWERDF
ncbi:PspC domain-containing protein [uncultured Shewanella sp.]|uniref:PspC domain-containing protein n=1 Tax=Shewanella atlantica TaxID=271099 RepID=UPI0026264A3B|nr:PspC domain-containing protein [uncultured Shewanella sp.]